MNLDRSLFATDDGKAIKAARFFNIPFIVTPKIVVELFRLEKISLKRARESLEKLSIIGRHAGFSRPAVKLSAMPATDPFTSQKLI
jgi:hypothetical protein